MKNFWNWIIKNLSNIFSIIGIILSLYFGVYYVPDWLVENQKEKVINAQRNLEESIKELIYADSICDYQEIHVLLKAKEIEINQIYPLTTQEVLIKVQESFMQDRFLPLLKRKELMKEVEIIKKQIPKKQYNRNKKENNTASLLGFLSVITTLFIVSIGSFSYYKKYKKEKAKDEEIENQLSENIQIFNPMESSLKYEQKIIEALQQIDGIEIFKNYLQRDLGFDIQFSYNGKMYFVECKYLTKSKVGLNSFENFINNQKGLDGIFWFVYNTDLTEMVKNRVEELNILSGQNKKVFLIRALNENEFREKAKIFLSAR